MLGISQEKLFTELTDEDIDKMIDINLKSVFYVTQETIKNMIYNKKRMYYKYIIGLGNNRRLV